MKMNKQYIVQMVKHLKRSGGSVRNSQIMHPMREWVIGLVVAAVLLGATAVWGTALYMSHRDVLLDEVEVETANTPYRERQVEDALAIFSEREQVFNSLITLSASEPAPVDTVVESVATSSATTTENAAPVVTSTPTSSTDIVSSDSEGDLRVE